jgi:hypothetical protein
MEPSEGQNQEAIIRGLEARIRDLESRTNPDKVGQTPEVQPPPIAPEVSSRPSAPTSPSAAAPQIPNTPTAQSQPIPSPSQPVGPTVPGVGPNPPAAGDEDVIEKEWVDQADKIVEQTKEDPHTEEEAVESLQVDYLKKRYGHDVKKPEGDS